MRDERGLFGVGKLISVLVLVGILGLGGYEAVAIILTKTKASDIAVEAADAAARAYGQTKSSAKASQAARAAASQEDASVVKVEFTNAGSVINVTVRKRASTIIIHRIGFLRRFAGVDGSHGSPVG